MSGPVLILAGGTGGHIFPGLAVAQALRARDVPVLWLGAVGGMETRLVPQAGVALETIAIGGLRGKGAMALLKAPFVLARACLQALSVLRRAKPRAVVSFGGYAAGPGGLCAWLLRRPLLVHEQNRAPGLTNRVLSRFAQRVLCGFPGSFPEDRAEVVGNPVRPAIAALPAGGTAVFPAGDIYTALWRELAGARPVRGFHAAAHQPGIPPPSGDRLAVERRSRGISSGANAALSSRVRHVP